MYTYIYIEIDIDIDRAVISVISQLGGMTIVTTDRMFIAIEKKSMAITMVIPSGHHRRVSAITTVQEI